MSAGQQIFHEALNCAAPAGRTDAMRVLVIEDSEIDFRLIARALGTQFVLTRESSLANGIRRSEAEQFDLVVLDLTLDDSSGYETFEQARAAMGELPIVVLSGFSDDELALRAVAGGAQDYISKSRLLDYPLDRTARYAIERRRAQDAAKKVQQQYKALFESLPMAAYTCDAQGLITYYNQKAIELWGSAPRLNDPADRYGGPLRLLSPSGEAIAHEQGWMARALRERRSFTGCEACIEYVNGERRNVLAHISPVLDEHGTLLGGINVITDISPLRRAERNLRESERFARAIVDSMAVQLAILDESGSVLSVNQAWQETAEEGGMRACAHGVGMNYLAVCDHAVRNNAKGDESGEYAARAAAGIRAVLQGQSDDFCMEYPCDLRMGHRWFALRVTPFDRDGPPRVVVSHDDITDRKVAEELAGEQRGLREAVTGMEKILAVVGHELRTPLAGLRAICEFLSADGVRGTVEADKFIAEISREVDRMSDTVNNILEAARLNSGKARWNWGKVELNEVLSGAIESVRPIMDAGRVKLALAFHGDGDGALGDADAIRRLVLNLLSNAQKYTNDGQIWVTGRRFRDSNGDWVAIEVADSGCGIPPEVMARLGEAFALNAGIVGANHVRGTGLGLAICRGIAEAHGGSIRFESTVGQGTKAIAVLRCDLECPVGTEPGYPAREAGLAA